MSRRTKQLFSLSLLDLLTSALGAIIFLFIITPKGGESPTSVRQAMVYFDTTQMKIYGDLPDSLLAKSAGDTLFTVLLAYKDLPKPAEQPKGKYVYNEPRPKPTPAPPQKKTVNQAPAKTRTSTPKRETAREQAERRKAEREGKVKKEGNPTTQPKKEQPKVYRGDAPSVPAKVSFEVKWSDKNDNVDLIVCKGNSCVYGGRKKDKNIGSWDSGKSRNRMFGNDLRTNQEAVRQFDKIIPGTYKLYAEFKESKQNRSRVTIKGLVYTKGNSNQERGENFSNKLELGKGRKLIATVTINRDGSYTIIK